MKLGKLISFCALSFFMATQAFAVAYKLPPETESLIGEIKYSEVEEGDTIATIAQRNDIGFNMLANANPDIDVSKPLVIGEEVTVPTLFLLPSLRREGIIINLPEMRMYYFPAGTDEVRTYPIGIGRIGKTAPITETYVVTKRKDPTWTPPADIREYNREQGIELPKQMPAGPDNPLGPFAIYLRMPGAYLIHSTIFPESIGRRASFGCIRMYETDIKDFFPLVQKNIPVAIINAPSKVGWQDDRLYLELHEALEEHRNAYDATLPGIVRMITDKTQKHPTLIDWQLVSYLAQERDGVPHEIGVRASN